MSDVPVQAGESATRIPWGRVLVVWGAGLPAAVGLGKIALASPLVRSDLGLSLVQLGWVISAITAVAVALGAPAGLWTRRYGARRTLLAGLAVTAVAGAGGAVATGFGTLVAARLVEGVGYLLIVIAGPDLLVRMTRGNGRDTALALWTTVIPTGLALAGLLSGALLTPLGWRGWLAVTALLPAVAALLVVAVIPADRTAAPTRPDPAGPDLAGPGPSGSDPAGPDPKDPSSKEPGQPYPRPAGLGATMLLSIGFCGLCLIGIGVISLFPTFLVTERSASIGAAGAATAIVSFSSAPGSLLAGWLLRRGTSLRTLSTVALLMPAAALPTFGLGAALGVAVATGAAILLTNGVAVAGSFAAVPRLVGDPGQIPLALGLMAQLGSLGTLIGAPLFGAAVTFAGWPTVAPLMLLTTLVTLALLFAATAASKASG